MYGVPKAIVAGIGFMVDETGFELLSTLRTETIKSLISLEEARGRLIELHRSDKFFRNHKDPAGNTYIHTLLRVPWNWRQDDQFGLLHTLVTECEMTLTDETQSFLVQCAEWIGEGRHLALLEAILSYGFDATAIHASPFEKWPAPCSTDWYGGGCTPDPFFVEYIGTILKYSPSYSGSTNLHNVLLNGSLDSAADWLHRSQPLERNVNFLGQTPLHIATTCPKLCQLVLEAGHDMNVRDKYGTTPLMYAAAMGQTEVTKLLISRGANPALRDSRLNWMFLDYAFFCDQWHLAMEALLVIQTKFNSRVFQSYVRCAIMSTLGHQNALTEEVTFLPKLIEFCDEVNFTFEDDGIKDNNLMHYARTLETASTLVRCGFNSFNQKNSEGKLPINSLYNCCNAPLIRFCLENGTDVSNMSQDGRSIFFELLPQLSSFDWLTWDVIDGIKLCLSAGADPFAADNCTCPCSPDGCHIASKLGLEFSPFSFLSGIPDPVWVLEFISLVEDYRGLRAAEKLLLSLHRRIRCDRTDISIAHVCCHRGRAIGRIGFQDRSLQSEDIEDILDEENDFIDVLDTEMRELASFTFSKLLTEFITHLKVKYNTHLENTRRKREKVLAESKSKGQVSSNQ
ncbi:Myotrophin [Fusarium oxysporum f. sp. rapae]|uniref:Myotrophin n=1 Tax=Fusarium oxysporum f. sp. rapae TaxID=485398 RepID=A0A8J5PA20_FUSOX|nr:Myotrophin [Fusarium oxysporum f. sp. rapae]